MNNASMTPMYKYKASQFVPKRRYLHNIVKKKCKYFYQARQVTRRRFAMSKKRNGKTSTSERKKRMPIHRRIWPKLEEVMFMK